jgi:hypothetical protein
VGDVRIIVDFMAVLPARIGFTTGCLSGHFANCGALTHAQNWRSRQRAAIETALKNPLKIS